MWFAFDKKEYTQRYGKKKENGFFDNFFAEITISDERIIEKIKSFFFADSSTLLRNMR